MSRTIFQSPRTEFRMPFPLPEYPLYTHSQDGYGIPHMAHIPAFLPDPQSRHRCIFRHCLLQSRLFFLPQLRYHINLLYVLILHFYMLLFFSYSYPLFLSYSSRTICYNFFYDISTKCKNNQVHCCYCYGRIHICI